MLKFYKSLLLVAIGISSTAYSMEDKKIFSNTELNIGNNNKRFLQRKMEIDNNNTIQRSAYDCYNNAYNTIARILNNNKNNEKKKYNIPQIINIMKDIKEVSNTTIIQALGKIGIDYETAEKLSISNTLRKNITEYLKMLQKEDKRKYIPLGTRSIAGLYHYIYQYLLLVYKLNNISKIMKSIKANNKVSYRILINNNVNKNTASQIILDKFLQKCFTLYLKRLAEKDSKRSKNMCCVNITLTLNRMNVNKDARKNIILKIRQEAEKSIPTLKNVINQQTLLSIGIEEDKANEISENIILQRHMKQYLEILSQNIKNNRIIPLGKNKNKMEENRSNIINLEEHKEKNDIEIIINNKDDFVNTINQSTGNNNSKNAIDNNTVIIENKNDIFNENNSSINNDIIPPFNYIDYNNIANNSYNILWDNNQIELDEDEDKNSLYLNNNQIELDEDADNESIYLKMDNNPMKLNNNQIELDENEDNDSLYLKFDYSQFNKL